MGKNDVEVGTVVICIVFYEKLNKIAVSIFKACKCFWLVFDYLLQI